MNPAIIAFARIVFYFVLVSSNVGGVALAQSEDAYINSLKQLAERGHLSSQISLGDMYYYRAALLKISHKVEQDYYREAAEWYRLAAEQGDISAQEKLGDMHYEGKGVPQNYKKAVKWYRLAVNQGLFTAQDKLDKAESKMKAEKKADEKNAYTEAYALAQSGNYIAQHNLGVMYAEGEGVAQNDKEAVKWYRLAADRGYADAQNNLGFMYLKGRGVPQNYREAYIWFSLAAANGEQMASRNREIVVNKVKDLTSFDLSGAQNEAAKRMAEIEAKKNQ